MGAMFCLSGQCWLLYLLQGLVVDKTGGILGNLKLALLNLLAELPRSRMSEEPRSLTCRVRRGRGFAQAQ